MFSNAFKLFSINGFDIKIDPSWALIAALITWSLSTQYFPISLPGQTFQTYLMMSLVAMMCFFASLILHELAHSIVARRLGLPVRGITLFMFGGVAELDSEPQSPNIEMWVAIAGPIMSLCLAIGFWSVGLIASAATQSNTLIEVLSYLAMINLILALFNLVPAFPLDGGRVLRAYLWQQSGDILHATRTAAQTGTVLAYGLMGLGVFALFQGFLISGIWQILIGTFILAIARSSYQSQLALTVFESKTVGDLMKSDPVTVDPSMTLEDFANDIMLHHGLSFAPVVEGTVLLGHMNQALLTKIDRENWTDTKVGDVFVRTSDSITVTGELPVKDLLDQISRTSQRKFLVVDEMHQLVGVISLADLTRYLHISEVVLAH